MNVWILVLFYVTNSGVASSQIRPLSEKGCKEQAIAYNMNLKIPIIALCVEQR